MVDVSTSVLLLNYSNETHYTPEQLLSRIHTMVELTTTMVALMFGTLCMLGFSFMMAYSKYYETISEKDETTKNKTVA